MDHNTEKTVNGISDKKEELYNTVHELDKLYVELGKEIFYTKEDGFRYYFEISGERDYGPITDSLRISYVDAALNNSEFLEQLTPNLQKKLKERRQSLSDPINLGYLLTNHQIGEILFNISTKRGYLNLANELPPDDGSDYMSEEDYVNYHNEKIHVINDTLAIYKNSGIELAIYENNYMLYFIFKRKDKNSLSWLLNDIQICSKEEEEAFDLKLIGKSKPIVYYEAKVFDYEGRY